MWSSADLTILVPMLHRAHRVDPLLASIRAATPDAAVLFLVSPSDLEVHDAIDHAGADRLTVEWQAVGDYARKINAGYRHTSTPLLFTGADDLHFHPGWFEEAAGLMDERVGVVGTCDLCNRRTRAQHSTHSLIARWYADRGTVDQPNAIYHEGYPHEWVDDELVGTAMKRKAYRHARKAIVEHLHPMADKAPMDDLYAAQGQRMAAGRDLYRRRRAMWK